jgi:putative N6-adenine-specific DNA methylase
VYQYQQTNRYVAQLAGGLEAEGATELMELGALSADPAWRAVYFEAEPSVLYRVNYRSRLATRVLAPLLTFDCHSDRYLYRTAREINWADFLTIDQSFAVKANVANSRISHSQFAALRLKDAIVDQFRERGGRRPNIDTRSPDVWFNLHIDNNSAVISVDTSGGSLHRRGYRTESLVAPMQETVAAAVLRLAGWAGNDRLYDPMCGSGTLLAEALMLATSTPAGFLRRRFGFERLPDFDQQVWNREKESADGSITHTPAGFISGSDVDGRAVAVARASLQNLPSGSRVVVKAADFRSLQALENTVIVCNPPYGLRMGAAGDMGAFYRSLGDFLKQKCHGCTAYIYFGEREWIKSVGLRTAFKKPLVSGALDGRLVKYELY